MSPEYDFLSRKAGYHVAAYADRCNFGPPSICSNGPKVHIQDAFLIQKPYQTRGLSVLWVFQIELTGSVILNSDCTAFSIAASSGDEMHLSGTV